MWKVKYPLCFAAGCVQPVKQEYDKNCLKSTSVMEIVTMKNTDDFYEALLSLSVKMNGTQRRTPVSP